MTVMRTLDGRLRPSAPFAAGTAARWFELAWGEGDDIVLPDVSMGGRERADRGRGRPIDGKQRETHRRRRQRARFLPGDRRGGRAGQELEDVAETDQVADQEALDEQQP